MSFETKLKWARFILFLAAAYNVVWGVVISLAPQLILSDDVSSPFMLIMLRCVGMLVGVYGIAYYIASKDPVKYWPLVLVGYIGKILGPIGAFYYVYAGEIKKEFLIVNVYNDLIWLIPFTWILYQAISGKLSRPVNDGKTLYQEALGSDWEKLAPGVKAFHSARVITSYEGTFNVKRGESRIGKLFGKMSGLPAAGDAVRAELTVIPSKGEERWNRIIGGTKIESRQWMEGGYLVERFQGIDISLACYAVDGRLIMRDASSAFMGIPLPPFFTIATHASVAEAAEGVSVNIDIRFRPFGRIINYSGNIRPVNSASAGKLH